MKHRIIFFGTPQLSADMLEHLSKSETYKITAVVTSPDVPVGRKQILTPSAVKQKSQELGIPCIEVENLDDECFTKLQKLDVDLFIIVAYGKLFPQKFLDLPRLGAFNLHFSLLPKYRGASPVQSALLNGEESSGYSIFQLVKQMDAGEIFVQEEMNIEGKNSEEVFEEMTELGGHALQKFCEEICTGKQFSPVKQVEAEATYCGKFEKKDGEIFPEKEASESILRKYRAFFLWPQIFLIDPKNGKRIKLLKITNYELPIANESSQQSVLRNQDSGKELYEPSTLQTFDSSDSENTFLKMKDTCLLKTSYGFLEIVIAQPEGKSEMSGMEFWNWWKQQ